VCTPVPVSCGDNTECTETKGCQCNALSKIKGQACVCGSDAPLQPQPIVAKATLLAGESKVCAALAVAACTTFAHCSRYLGYKCYTASGNLSATYDEDEFPCSKNQLQQWAELGDACWKLVPATAMPLSPLRDMLHFAKIPAQVCANVDGTKFWFVAGCAMHVYSGSGNGGCNIKGGSWTLKVSPPTTAALNTGTYPFLHCSDFGAGYGLHGFDLTQKAEVLRLTYGWACGGCSWNLNTPGPYDSLAWFAKAFVSCDVAIPPDPKWAD